MKRYHQYCPVAQALELVGDRWTLLVVRELYCGAQHFGDILRGIPRMPRSMLSRRLDQLVKSGLVDRHDETPARYTLSEAGHGLEDVLAALGLWARRHAHRQLLDDEIDAGLLMWNVQRGLSPDHAPKRPTLVRFEFIGGPCGVERYWLKVAGGDGELCLTHPGMTEALVVRSSARVLTEVWLGHRGFRATIASGELMVEGDAELAEALPSWFLLNDFVRLEQEQP